SAGRTPAADHPEHRKPAPKSVTIAEPVATTSRRRLWLMSSAGAIALVLAGFIGVWVTRPPTVVDSHLAGPELPPTDEKGEAVRPDPTHYRPVRLDRHVAESDPSADLPIAAAKPESVVSPPADIVAF